MCTFNREGSFYLAISEKQCSPYIMLYLGSIGMDHFISESCYIKRQFY